ncbi:MAG: hypothetical protein JKY52_17470, partial [Flavobacteriales bacterium]|nr:hypothetical protein [Flavobacteriales bacterium]
VAYISLFGVFYLIGTHQFFQRQKLHNNGYLTIGTLGTTSLLLSLSFDWFWKEIAREEMGWYHMASSPEGVAIALLTLLGVVMMFLFNRKGSWKDLKPFSFIFLLFIPTFIIGSNMLVIGIVIVNAIILALGLLTIKRGAKEDNLGLMNYGLIILTGLITCRFFDSDINYVLRGILFLILGLGFFGTNYWMLNKRKTQSHAA